MNKIVTVGAYHGARLALFTGAGLILQDGWEAQEALEMMEQFGCAFTAAATPFLKDLVDADWTGPLPKLNSLKSFLCGGAPVPPVLMEQSRKEFPNTFVTNLWGMTEGGLVTCVPDSSRKKIITTAGIGLPGLELRVLDVQVRNCRLTGRANWLCAARGCFLVTRDRMICTGRP